MALPSSVTYCAVTGRFLLALGDTSEDVDRLPDGPGLSGATVTFTASVPRVRVPSEPATIIPVTVTCSTDAAGYLYSPGATLDELGLAAEADRVVYLVAGDNEALSPHGWTYSVRISHSDILQISATIYATSGGVIDLASVIEVPSSTGTAVIEWQTAVDATGANVILAQAAQSAAQSARDAAITAQGLAEDARDALLAAASPSATGDSLAQRTPSGTLVVAPAVASGEAVTLGQMDALSSTYETQANAATAYAPRGVKPWKEQISERVLYYAHRNGGDWAPDNSRIAAQLALACGADVVEGDVRMLADGTLVLMHDATVDRTTNGTGNVSDFVVTKWSKLLIDDAPGTGGWPSEAPPTLEQFLQEFGGKSLLHFQLYPEEPTTQAKRLQVVAAVNALVTRMGIPKNTIGLSNTYTDALAAIHAAGFYSLLISSEMPADLAAIAATGCDEVHLKAAYCTAPNVAAIHAAGMKVSCWAPDTIRERDIALAAGCDAIMTDRVGYLSGRLGTRTTDAFAAQDYHPAHFRQAGTAGTFTAPDSFGWNNPGTVCYNTLGYLEPPDGTNFTLSFTLAHTAGWALVWIGATDDFDANAAAANRTGCNGYLVTIRDTGLLRIEQVTNGAVVNLLASVSTGTYTLPKTATWSVQVTPTTIRWTRGDNAGTAVYTEQLYRPLKRISIGATGTAVVQYKDITLT